jgi:type II secretory pathway pseudopilin PulG
MMIAPNITTLATLLRTGLRRTASTRAFSLVEVLISIVVLALGLVGLAAVFPVVVQQQRTVSDSIQGASVERSAEDLVRGNALLSVRALPFDDDSNPIWRDLVAEEPTSNIVWSPSGQWNTATPFQTGDPLVLGLNVNSTTGDLIIASQSGFAAFPTSERLNPTPFTSRAEPRFVWDIAARRVERRTIDAATGARIATADRAEGDRESDPIQVATFVRRIDGNIRFDRRGLAFALTRPEGNADARLPLGADALGRPTLDGRGTATANNYSTIQRITYTIGADPDTGELNRLIPDESSELIAYARQIGQKFVDRAGIVRTVRSIATTPEGDFEALVIEPPMSAGAVDNEEADFNNLLELLFTPQIPASVGVFTINR